MTDFELALLQKHLRRIQYMDDLEILGYRRKIEAMIVHENMLRTFYELVTDPHINESCVAARKVAEPPRTTQTGP